MYKDTEITISLEQFLALRDDATMCGELLDVLFEECTLGYGGAILFNDQNINGYLKYAAPDRYSRKLKELKELNALKAEKGEE